MRKHQDNESINRGINLARFDVYLVLQGVVWMEERYEQKKTPPINRKRFHYTE